MKSKTLVYGYIRIWRHSVTIFFEYVELNFNGFFISWAISCTNFQHVRLKVISTMAVPWYVRIEINVIPWFTETHWVAQLVPFWHCCCFCIVNFRYSQSDSCSDRRLFRYRDSSMFSDNEKILSVPSTSDTYDSPKASYYVYQNNTFYVEAMFGYNLRFDSFRILFNFNII